MKRITSIQFFFFFTILLIGGWITFKNRHIICVSLHCDIPRLPKGFTKISTYQNTSSRFQALYHRNNDVAQVNIQRGIPESEAQGLIEHKVASITSLYEKRFVAYPDVISNEIVCADSFKPIVNNSENNGAKIRYLTGLATKRLTFGACADDLIFYKSLVAWYWCAGSNSLIQLELMIPKESPEAELTIQRTIQSISCH